MDLRCDSRLHAVLIKPSNDEGLVEVACSSRFCGKTEGVVVIHRFNTNTGELVSTRRFSHPMRKR